MKRFKLGPQETIHGYAAALVSTRVASPAAGR